MYHLGVSSKDSGKKISTIMKIEDSKLYYDVIDNLLIKSNLNLK